VQNAPSCPRLRATDTTGTAGTITCLTTDGDCLYERRTQHRAKVRCQIFRGHARWSLEATPAIADAQTSAPAAGLAWLAGGRFETNPSPGCGSATAKTESLTHGRRKRRRRYAGTFRRLPDPQRSEFCGSLGLTSSPPKGRLAGARKSESEATAFRDKTCFSPIRERQVFNYAVASCIRTRMAMKSDSRTGSVVKSAKVSGRLGITIGAVCRLCGTRQIPALKAGGN